MENRILWPEVVWGGRWVENETMSEEADDGVELLPQLRDLYRDYLRPDLVSIRFVHRDGACLLITETRASAAGGAPTVFKETDLGVIAADVDLESPMFDPSRAVGDNARIFIEDLDAETLLHCTDLLTDQAAADLLNGES